MNIPATLGCGNTWTWTESLPNYPATTYTLKYTIYRLGSLISITAEASGTNHLVNVSAETTAGYSAGSYSWDATVEKGSGSSLERYTVGSGTVTIKPNLAYATAATDHRSVAAIMLANVEEAMKRLASREVDSVSVNGRTVTYANRASLIKWRSDLKKEVAAEQAAEKIAQGIDPGRRILTRFQ